MALIINGKIVAGAGKDGEGIAKGGTTGQILTKKSNNDFDTEWKDISIPDVSNKQNKLTGTSGQVVGFDSNGNAIAQDAPIPDMTQYYTKSEVDAAIAADIQAAFANIARAEEVEF